MLLSSANNLGKLAHSLDAESKDQYVLTNIKDCEKKSNYTMR